MKFLTEARGKHINFRWLSLRSHPFRNEVEIIPSFGEFLAAQITPWCKWSRSSEFTVVWFYLSSRVVISLSSHYWNLVFRIGQSFPAIIASICYTNTCVLAIKFSKTLSTPRTFFWLGSSALMFHLRSVWVGICLAAGSCFDSGEKMGETWCLLWDSSGKSNTDICLENQKLWSCVLYYMPCSCLVSFWWFLFYSIFIYSF